MVPCKSTAEEVLFEWSHHRISSIDSAEVRALLHVSTIDSGSERVYTHTGLTLNKAEVFALQRNNPEHFLFYFTDQEWIQWWSE